jgi:quinol monooxygenase YgiN
MRRWPLRPFPRMRCAGLTRIRGGMASPKSVDAGARVREVRAGVDQVGDCPLRPGAEADFDTLVARTAAGIRASEPGTLVYACRVQDKPRERIFYELYRDRAAFDAHEATEHTRRFLAKREPLLEAKDVDFLDLAGGKTPVTEAASDV